MIDEKKACVFCEQPNCSGICYEKEVEEAYNKQFLKILNELENERIPEYW